MSDGTIMGLLWSVAGFMVAMVATAFDSGQAGLLFTIGAMLVSATWYLGIRFSKVESRLSSIEQQLHNQGQDNGAGMA